MYDSTAAHESLQKLVYSSALHLASFPGSCAGEEEREPGTHCLCMHQVPLVTCILLCYTKITVNSVHLLEDHTAWLYSLWDVFDVKTTSLDGKDLHSFV